MIDVLVCWTFELIKQFNEEIEGIHGLESFRREPEDDFQRRRAA